MTLIDVAFSKKQVSCPATSSPSPRKPAWVVEDWLALKLPIRIAEPAPVSRQDLARVHDHDYVEGGLNCRIPNGFRGRDADVAESLRWTVESFLTAARLALENSKVACSSTSGFHHAGICSGHGYSTFNGLLVAAKRLRDDGALKRVGIIDCDQHFGDGTAEIIDEYRLDWIAHYSREHFLEYPRFGAGPHFLEALPGMVRGMAACDLLMYGGWRPAPK